MKKYQILIFISFTVIIALGAWAAYRQISSLPAQVVTEPEIITVYDEVLNLSGCSMTGADSCKILDQTDTSNLAKTVIVNKFITGSGYLAVYFKDVSELGGTYNGGFNADSVYFEPSSGGREELGSAFQVFERGNVVLEFVQPYTSSQRLDAEYEFVIYYLPHSEAERQAFLTRLQTDPVAFNDYKEDVKNNVDAICGKLTGTSRVPAACPGGQSIGLAPSGSTGTGFVSDPTKLPEYDFSGQPNRKPEVTLNVMEYQTFIGEPVTIRVDNVYDPDGKCRFFQYVWQKPDRLEADQPSVDAYLGDLFFIPRNAGSFTVRLLLKEACKELGSLASERINVLLIVNDKSTAFSDLAQAPKYQNAMLDLYHLGVLKGYDDGTMRPNQNVNRAEFLKMVFETLQYNIDKTTYSPRYTDVDPEVWFAPYVSQADILGVIKGYPDGKFHPERTVNLVEALKMAMMFTTLEIMDGVVVKFADVKPDEDWFSRYVQTAYREGILPDLQPGGNVYPGQAITRGKAALIIERTLLYPTNRINETNRDVLRRVDTYEDFSTFQY